MSVLTLFFNRHYSKIEVLPAYRPTHGKMVICFVNLDVHNFPFSFKTYTLGEQIFDEIFRETNQGYRHK